MSERNHHHRRIRGQRTARVAAALAMLTLLGATGCQQQTPDGPAEPMELQGRWLGMGVAGTESQSAQALGIPPTVKGVAVTELADPQSRAAEAGVMVGDVIAAVEGQPVTNLAELYTLSTRQGTARPLTLDLVRAGQPMRATLTGPGGVMAGMAASMAPGVTAQGGPQFYCPTDGVRWSHADVHPNFRCPRCGGPVTSVTQ